MDSGFPLFHGLARVFYSSGHKAAGPVGYRGRLSFDPIHDYLYPAQLLWNIHHLHSGLCLSWHPLPSNVRRKGDQRDSSVYRNY